MYSFLIRFFASGFFSGYLPFAPGTLATLLALVIYVVLPKNTLFYLLFTLVTFFAGIYFSDRAEKIYKNKDDRRIVIDEIAGFFVAMLFLPGTPKFIFLVFLLYRFFDIVKFSLIRKVQSLPGGWGIMLDDFLAALFANFIVRVLSLTIYL